MKTYCVANWKMTGSLDMIHDYVATFSKDLKDYCNPQTLDIILAPPTPYLSFTASKCTGFPISIAAQDCTAADKAASTSEVSAEMLKDVGTQFVIIGHSEYRERHTPKPLDLATKLHHVLKAQLTPIFCIGESLEAYESQTTKEVLSDQLALLQEIKTSHNMLIAYEPIWAIGSGQTPTTLEIHEICQWIHDEVSKRTGMSLPIIYGGSVNPENATEILALQSLQGVLVGGSSLDPQSFTSICKAASKVSV